jgi:hypothetical protein
MTAHYGAASGPANNKSAPTNVFKQEGPEEDTGFGTDSTPPHMRKDRRARGGFVKRAAGGSVIARRKGGKIAHRDSGGDVSDIEKANRDQAMTKERAAGGRTKHKGSTHVNVIVAPQGQGGPGGVRPVPPVAGPPGLPPGLPPGGPPPGMPPMAGGMPPRPPMGVMPPPGAMPPGMIPPRARGGKVGGLSEQGLKPSETGTHVQPKNVMKTTPSGTHVKQLPHRTHTAGGGSGHGRLEKIGGKGHHAGKPQVV